MERSPDPDLISPPAPVAPSHGHLMQRSLRRIIRAIDLFSHRLVQEHGITAPQLTCLVALVESGDTTLSELSRLMLLSPSTMVGILDRLEARGLIARLRSSVDRRQVRLTITDSGRALVDAAPSPLQQALAEGMGALSGPDQQRLADALGTVANMLDSKVAGIRLPT